MSVFNDILPNSIGLKQLDQAGHILDEQAEEAVSLYGQLGALGSSILVFLIIILSAALIFLGLYAYERITKIRLLSKNGNHNKDLINLFKENLDNIYTKIDKLSEKLVNIDTRLKLIEEHQSRRG